MHSGIPECTINFDTLDLSNVSKFVVHSGIPECTINFDTLDLFFRRPDDDSIESKHVALSIFV